MSEPTVEAVAKVQVDNPKCGADEWCRLIGVTRVAWRKFLQQPGVKDDVNARKDELRAKKGLPPKRDMREIFPETARGELGGDGRAAPNRQKTKWANLLGKRAIGAILDDLGKSPEEFVEEMLDPELPPDIRVRVRTWFLEQHVGKPDSKVTMDATVEDKRVDLSKLSEEDLLTYLALTEKASADAE